jgi:choline dehydrogenase
MSVAGRVFVAIFFICPERVGYTDLRVHGILGLRVADASVIPRIITGPGTNASIHIIAGRAGKLILG